MLTKIIKPEDSDLNSQNCLHLAIEKGCRFTQRIIDKCSVDVPEIFQQGDKEGTKNTPLHLAVMKLLPPDELENQEQIIRCLITANRETLLKENGKHDVPYQARIRKLGEQEELAPHENIDRDGNDTTTYHTTADLGIAEASTVGSVSGTKNEIEGDLNDRELSEEGGGRADEDLEEEDEEDEDSEEEYEEDEDDEVIMGPSKNALAEDDEYLTREEKSDFRHKVVHDPILKIIRSFSIREFERSDVATALYHQVQERETYFNLSGRSDLTITTAYLGKLARHLKFENVLSYVALPKLAVLDSESTDVSSPTNLGPKGRRDMGKIFQWLRDKQVETIHAVTVIDSTEPSHSDAAIEEALTGFNIEVWDWKKLDRNCDVIANCTKGVVRDISLYSSGNYAVLMGWASNDGLRCLENFPQLKHVHLYYQEGLEDETRLEQYIDAFVMKLRRHQNKDGEYIEVTATKDDKKNSYMDGFRVRHGARSTSQWGNRWMDSMTQFLQVIFNIPMKEAGYVKIAVVDNGVDASLDALDGKIAAGASFCPIPNTSYHNPYYMTSETISHGSMVAGLICRMCPKAKLYVARIDELPSAQGKLLLTAESAAKAIDWAVKKKVDVICMSWTIEPNDGQNDAGIEQLRAAISKAESNGITMLCSASDQGSDAKASLPTSTQKCIRVGAGTENGDKCSWVHGDDYDYCFPGENVPLKTGRDGLVKMYSGSSVATAIAAGSVGLLLYLDKLIAMEVGGGEPRGQVDEQQVSPVRQRVWRPVHRV
ncbi:putative peptidase S8 subtilisin kexin [Rosellinia necatrix]|uniref:Putative peptidase S8 subtilisin kexin n=1 Tax=Rosellinia necatrix TaxID=77044 RepID=A0A1S8A8Q7_ROSNE|nr:putative peptidase S8 subtilisin kexin [Rosellinia necatrix]